MRKLLLIFLIIGVLSFLVVGCGGSTPGPGPIKKTYTMQVVISQEAVGGSAISQKFIRAASVSKDSSWFVERPANGFLGSIGRNSAGEFNGQVDGVVVIKDNLGNVIEPVDPNMITWTCTQLPALTWYGPHVGHSSPTQIRYDFHVIYQGRVLVADDPEVIYENVDLSTDAVMLIVNRNTLTPPYTYTQYYSMTAREYMATAGESEIYRTIEDGVTYVNAPYGIAEILDQEIDPATGLIYGRISGCVKSVPSGLTYSTKVPLEELYSTFIVKLSGGGYAKVTIWDSASLFGLALYYSTCGSDGVFPISY